MRERTLLFCETCGKFFEPNNPPCMADEREDHRWAEIPLAALRDVPEVRELVKEAGLAVSWMNGRTSNDRRQSELLDAALAAFREEERP